MTALAFALLAAFGGALLTAIAGGIGALWQARREHARWIREQRYETLVDIAALIRSVERAFSDVTTLVEAAKIISVKLTGELSQNERAKLTKQSAQIAEKLAAVDERIAEHYRDFVNVAGPFDILGPDELSDEVGLVIAAIGSRDASKVRAARKRFVGKARKVLDIEA